MAFTAYDDETEPILDPTYGKIAFNSFSWGFGESFESIRAPLNTRSCTRAELGLDDSAESAFYPIRNNSKKTVEKYWKKFMCIDKEDMYIHGSYNSDKARLMNI